jgi:hypothetical protein
MAINKNHLFDDLDGVKCAIVESNVSAERVAFLKELLTHNRYEVIVVPSPQPKATPPPKPVEARPPARSDHSGGDDSVGRGEEPAPVVEEKIPETFTVGVTDVSFNAINAIFGRLLKTKNGNVVTLAYWQQKESVSNDEKPYYS